MIYEFSRMADDPDVATPTLDLVIDSGWVLPEDPIGDLRRMGQQRL